MLLRGRDPVTGRRRRRLVPGPPPATPGPPGHRSLVNYVSAATVTILGERFGELALPLVVLAATGDPAAAGLVAAGIHAPGLLLALWLGAGVDRHPRRRLMIGANLGRAACLGVFAWLAAVQVSGVWAYLVVGFALGCGNVLFGLAGFALLPQLVQGSRLVRANAMLEAGDAAVTIAGPAAAGAVIARLSAVAALGLNAVSYLVSALLLLAVRVAPPAESAPAEAPARANRPGGGLTGRLRRLPDIWRPYLAVLRDPTQRTVQVAFVALSAHGASVVLALIVLAGQELSLPAFQLGLVLGAAGVGGLVASAVAGRWPGPFRTFPGLATMLGLSAGFLVVLAVAPRFWWALVANALVDAAVTGAFIAVATLRQQRTPGSVLGRVTAASALCNAGARVVAVAATGALLAGAGARPTLLLGAGMMLLAAAYVAGSRAGPRGRGRRR